MVPGAEGDDLLLLDGEAGHLVALDQVDDLVAVLAEERALDGHVAGGESVVDALARRAELLVGVVGSFFPGPSALREHGLALGADLEQVAPRLRPAREPPALSGRSALRPVQVLPGETVT